MNSVMNVSAIYKMKEKIWLYPGESANWHFITIPKKYGLNIKEKYGNAARGFGSLPVEVTIGKTTWQTSIFPDKYSGSYILPVKAIIRKKESLQDGERVNLKMQMR